MKLEKNAFGDKIKKNIRSKLISGIIVLIPLGITFFILRIFYRIIKNLLLPILPFFPKALPQSYAFLISLFILLFFLYLVGFISSIFIGRRFISLVEKIFLTIPLVSTIYSATKKVISILSSSPEAKFKSVVFVEFPTPGNKAIGFITGTIQNNLGEKYYKVFIPTAPNPTSGFLEFIPPEKVKETQLSVEEAIQIIISGGILSPETLDL